DPCVPSCDGSPWPITCVLASRTRSCLHCPRLLSLAFQHPSPPILSQGVLSVGVTGITLWGPFVPTADDLMGAVADCLA
ncbi:hypothetical protein NDU88_003036, partial [Pleurodeles waltl]